MEKIREALIYAKNINFKLHANILSVPILPGFKKVDTGYNQIVSFAKDENKNIIQLISDGPLNNEETFEERLNIIIDTTKKMMLDYKIENTEPIKYLKTYKTNDFDFKVYLQENIKNNGNTNMIVMQINAYFLEPIYKDVYQLSYNTEAIKINDLNKDEKKAELEQIMNYLMENINYVNLEKE